MSRIYDEQRSFACRNGTRNFIAEINVSRCVDQIKHILLSVVRCVQHLNRMAFDRDSTFTLDVHVIQGLFLQLAVRYGPRQMQEAVGERTLPMVNMGDDAEISCAFHSVKCGAKIHLYRLRSSEGC